MMDIGPPRFVGGWSKTEHRQVYCQCHTGFNFINAIFFLIFLKYLVKVTCWLVPKKKDEGAIEKLRYIKFIDNRYIDTPSVPLHRPERKSFEWARR